MNLDWIKTVMSDPSITATAKNVAFVLAESANEDGASVATRVALARSCGCSSKSASRAIGELLRKGQVVVHSINGFKGVKLSRQPEDLSAQPDILSTQQRVSPLSPPLASPPLSPFPKSNTDTDRLKSKTKGTSNLTHKSLEGKSPRYCEVWALMSTVEFVTKDGTLETVIDNVANPEVVCDYLAGEQFAHVDASDAFAAASAWTGDTTKNRRDKLGMFMRGWFKRDKDKAPAKEQGRHVRGWKLL